jgi:copper chaperone CopZ
MFSFLKKQAANTNSQVTFQIDGMHCTSCSLTIEAELEELPGVVSANVSYAKSLATIEYLPQEITETKLKTKIASLGYTTR